MSNNYEDQERQERQDEHDTGLYHHPHPPGVNQFSVPQRALPPYSSYAIPQDFGYHQHQHEVPIQSADGMQASGPQPPTKTVKKKGKEQREKKPRLSKACDLCSKRKTPCSASFPCAPCVKTGAECTFRRPMRTRGPVNKTVEEAKRQQRAEAALREAEEKNTFLSQQHLGSPQGVFATEGQNQWVVGTSSAPATDNMAPAQTLVAMSTRPVNNSGTNRPAYILEDICSRNVIELFVNDFFTFIHPLAPFPHEPSFRQRLQKREDFENPKFLALIASMIGALAASFPRNTELRLESEGRHGNSVKFVEHCHTIAVHTRGTNYLESNLGIDDIATSYFLGLADGYVLKWERCRLRLGETKTMSAVLGLDEGEGPFREDNLIDQQIGRRIFYTMLVGFRSLVQIGRNHPELVIAPETLGNRYPPLPMEVDDEFIHSDRIIAQPVGRLSIITGFNAGVNTYLSVTPLATLELYQIFDPEFYLSRQEKVLQQCLHNAKDVLNTLPMELQPVAGSRSARSVQYEVQQANIYASNLGVRSYIVEKLIVVAKAKQEANQPVSPHPGSLLSAMLREREVNITDMFNVVTNLARMSMEANGGSFVSKIRQVASTLLAPADQSSPFAVNSEAYLDHFLKLLSELEGASKTGEDKGDRLVADIRQIQLGLLQ